MSTHTIVSGFSKLTRDERIQWLARQTKDAGELSNYVYLAAGWNLLVEIGITLGIDLDKPTRARKVGNEFEGLFGKPTRPQTAQAKVEKDQSVLYGRSHEFLLPDIHREKGMHCIDCHGPDEVKADASKHPPQHDAVKVRCETCHGTNSRAPTGLELRAEDPRAEELIKKNQLNPDSFPLASICSIITSFISLQAWTKASLMTLSARSATACASVLITARPSSCNFCLSIVKTLFPGIRVGLAGRPFRY